MTDKDMASPSGGLSSLRDGADKPSPPKASIPDAVEEYAHTLEWCAEQGRIEGLHPERVRKAAKLLREQAKQIAEMAAALRANTPTVMFEEREGLVPYMTEQRFTFVAALPQAYQVETQSEAYWGYPVEVEARRAVAMFAEQFKAKLMPLAAQAIEARRAETETGSVHESAVRKDAPKGGQQ